MGQTIKNRTGNIQCLEIELLSGKYVYVDEQIYNIEDFTKDYMQEEQIVIGVEIG